MPTDDKNKARLEAALENLKIEREIAEMLKEKQAVLKINAEIAQRKYEFEVDSLRTQMKLGELDKEAEKAAKRRIADLKEQAEAEQKLYENREKAAEAGQSLGENLNKTLGISTSGFSQLISDTDGLREKFKLVGKAAAGMGKQLAKGLLSPTNILMSLGTRAIEVANQLDKMNYAMYKSTGVQDLGRYAAKGTEGLESLVTRSQELQNAVQGLQSGYKGYIDMVMSGDAKQRATANRMKNTVAIMEQYGISAQESGEAMGFMVKSLGMAPEAAEATSREMVTLGKSLKIAPAEIISGFNKARGELAKYGKGMVGEFKKLQAQAKALNMDVGDLTNTMGAFDTFESAAEMTGQLNAWLGGPYLNSIEMVGMSESQRLETIKSTFEEQGKSFDQLSKFEKKGIAKSLGTDVETLGKMWRTSGDEMDKAADQAKTPAETQAELSKQMADNMDAMTKLSNRLDKILDDMAKKFTEIFGKDPFEAFTDSLKWIADNMGTILKVAGAIGAMWAGGKVIKGLTKAKGMVQGYKQGGFAGAVKGAMGETDAASGGNGMPVFVTNWPEGGGGGGGGFGGDDGGDDDGGFGLEDLDVDDDGPKRRCGHLKGKAKKRCRRKKRRDKKRRSRSKNRRRRNKDKARKKRTPRRKGGRKRPRARGKAGRILNTGAALFGLAQGGDLSDVGGAMADMLPQSGGEIAEMAAEQGILRTAAGALRTPVGTLAARGGMAALGTAGAVAGAGWAGWEAGKAMFWDESDHKIMENVGVGDVAGAAWDVVTGNVKGGVSKGASTRNKAAWDKQGLLGKASYCDKHGRTMPGSGSEPCSVVWTKRGKQFRKAVAAGAPDDWIMKVGTAMYQKPDHPKLMAALNKARAVRAGKVKSNNPKQVNDAWALTAGMSNTRFNASDQVMAIKEGGFMDKRLSKMIELLEKLVNSPEASKEVVVKVDKKELGRAVMGSINNAYSMR